MTFDQKDLDRGFKICGKNGCTHKHILMAGTDYPDECWITCFKCGELVVDELLEIKDKK